MFSNENENLKVYLPLYSLAHCILYFEPQVSSRFNFPIKPQLHEQLARNENLENSAALKRSWIMFLLNVLKKRIMKPFVCLPALLLPSVQAEPALPGPLPCAQVLYQQKDNLPVRGEWEITIWASGNFYDHCVVWLSAQLLRSTSWKICQSWSFHCFARWWWTSCTLRVSFQHRWRRKWPRLAPMERPLSLVAFPFLPVCDTVCTFGPKTPIRPPLDNPPGLHVGRRPLLLDP